MLYETEIVLLKKLTQNFNAPIIYLTKFEFFLLLENKTIGILKKNNIIEFVIRNIEKERSTIVDT